MWVVYRCVKPEMSTLVAASWLDSFLNILTIDSSYIVYRLPPKTTSTTMAARSKEACMNREQQDWSALDNSSNIGLCLGVLITKPLQIYVPYR